MEEDIMKEQKEEASGKTKGASEYSRRGILKWSAALLLGGIAGRMSNAYAAPAPNAPAPPLPWKWTKLDPMEAGTRAYQNYLKNKG
jgi:hypothetical protein